MDYLSTFLALLIICVGVQWYVRAGPEKVRKPAAPATAAKGGKKAHNPSPALAFYLLFIRFYVGLYLSVCRRWWFAVG
jgi:hypothetical protein